VEACPEAEPSKVAQFRALRARLDPFQLTQAIDQKLDRLYAFAHHRPLPTRNDTTLPPGPKPAIEALTKRQCLSVYGGTAALARATGK
jgi:hypothetical protein